MGDLRRYGTSFVTTAQAANNMVQAVVGLLSLAISLLAAWRFGVAWGVATALACLFTISTLTGLRLQRDVGTLIPPGHCAIVTGSPAAEGEWVPPGYDVTMGRGAVGDKLGNSATGGDARVYGGKGNTAVNTRRGRPPWCPEARLKPSSPA